MDRRRLPVEEIAEYLRLAVLSFVVGRCGGLIIGGRVQLGDVVGPRFGAAVEDRAGAGQRSSSV